VHLRGSPLAKNTTPTERATGALSPAETTREMSCGGFSLMCANTDSCVIHIRGRRPIGAETLNAAKNGTQQYFISLQL
jgi:hypothetical protein